MGLVITQGYLGEAGGTLAPSTRSGYPIDHDHLQAFCLSAGVVTSADDHLDYRRAFASAVKQWERDTGYSPFAPTAQTRSYDVPSGKSLDLRGGLVSLAWLTSSDGNVWTEGQDYALMPRNAPIEGKPYTAIEFAYAMRGRSYGFASITVAGVFGYSDEVPADAIHAILCLGASMLVPTRSTQVGAATTIKQDDVELAYSSISAAAAAYTAQQNQFLDTYKATVSRYKKKVFF